MQTEVSKVLKEQSDSKALTKLISTSMKNLANEIVFGDMQHDSTREQSPKVEIPNIESIMNKQRAKAEDRAQQH